MSIERVFLSPVTVDNIEYIDREEHICQHNLEKIKNEREQVLAYLQELEEMEKKAIIEKEQVKETKKRIKEKRNEWIMVVTKEKSKYYPQRYSNRTKTRLIIRLLSVKVKVVELRDGEILRFEQSIRHNGYDSEDNRLREKYVYEWEERKEANKMARVLAKVNNAEIRTID